MRATTLLLLAFCLVVSACSTPLPDITQMLTPYKFDKVQGNVVTREQVDALRPGMTRQQVREILGTPLLNSVFHGDRWDFVFTFYHQGAEPQSRHFSVFFKGDTLDHFDGQDLPREAEFVASLKSLKELDKLPLMVATPESLQAFAERGKAAAQDAPGAAGAGQLRDAAALPAGQSTSYPPLEPRQP